jgi:hypothetical protein
VDNFLAAALGIISTTTRQLMTQIKMMEKFEIVGI